MWQFMPTVAKRRAQWISNSRSVRTPLTIRILDLGGHPPSAPNVSTLTRRYVPAGC